ncbi:MAG: ATP-binding protein [Dehalococcoidales bacterium]|nr:ATP-binding protein [Dehalococcoidales bacterium]
MRKLFSSVGGKSSYERDIHLFLSFSRFAGFAVAASLLGIVFNERLDDPRMLLVVGSLGAYTILKILVHFRLWQRDIVTYIILLGDLAICVALVLLSGGSDSPFLLYSLLPVITTALFFEMRISLLIAALSSLNLILAGTVLTGINPSFTPVMESNSIGSVVTYCLFSFLIATITYPSNLNVFRRIESKAIVDERRRLRQEIHDGIAQVQGYFRTKIELLKKDLPSSAEELSAELEEMYQLLSESSADIRETIDFLDVNTSSTSLVAFLSSYTKELGKKTGSQVEFVVSQKLPALHPTAQLQLLRVAQEALTNVRKYAAATQIWVKLENTPQGVELLIKDNGRGFSPSEQKGTGLKIIEERVTSISGILTVTSSPGGGTEVRVRVPRK